MEAEAIITQVIPGEGFYTFVPFPETYLLDKQGITAGRLVLDDGRRISNSQRCKIFAIIGDITEWMKSPSSGKRSRAETETLREMHLLYLIDALGPDKSHNVEMVRRQLMLKYCRILDLAPFSLSDVDMTTARDFIDWLVELCIEHGVPCMDTLSRNCEDIGRYIYACLIHKKSCLSGKKAELHHCDHIGAGRNRKEITHAGMRAMPLTRAEHTEAHTIGQKTFEEKYHVFGIPMDADLCRIWNVKG